MDTLHKKKIVFFVLLLILYGFFLFQRIDFSTADLGRHIKNGELLLSGAPGVLSTNFYSYTTPDFPFVNHHWVSGVLFFLVFSVLGFSGVHLLFVITGLVTFCIFFFIAKRESRFSIAAATSLLVIPLLAQRVEVRPEAFSYLFAGLMYLILWKFSRGEISRRWLFAIPLLEMLWVNMHIYFVIGYGLVLVFLFEEYVRHRARRNARFLSLIFLLTIAASLANPFFVRGITEPFRIFQNYGYRLVENQSVPFLIEWGMRNPAFLFFGIVAAALIASSIAVFRKTGKDSPLAHCMVSMAFGVMAFLALRNFALFGFFVLPALSANAALFLGTRKNMSAETRNDAIRVFAGISALLFFLAYRTSLGSFVGNFGLGLLSNASAAAEFFKQEQIQGPILNNYDIGGYLIFFLSPAERVFTDNRPEAYPAEFFQNIYIPLQEREEEFRKQEGIYRWNAIFFSHRDHTPWGQTFLLNRVKDDAWAPVYADQYAIIFLLRNDKNKNVIERYEIPRSAFVQQ